MQEIIGRRWLEELQLIQATLLPEELLTFLDDQGPLWAELLLDYGDSTITPTESATSTWPSSPPRISVNPQVSSTLRFEAQFQESALPKITVKSENATRAEQEHWQDVVRLKTDEVTAAGSEFPVYELLCLHILPLLHEHSVTADADSASQPTRDASPPLADTPRFHALFTSHHLISPKKRRALHNWSASLSLSGFAKVGYPGVIYAQGAQPAVEEFVANVKGMQWLALKLRFLEPLPPGAADGGVDAGARGWRELDKVGEAVEAMRRLGREEWIVEMGVGSKSS